ncbi:MAG: PD-(D/E)XK nuclease family protein [Caulobacteraceae bacterium]|nr:PD-(D/E)XK nuclease family protein [Caulobacteraceae bacterium]
MSTDQGEMDVGLGAPRRSIQEFWVDFLLEEEFQADPAFASAFAAACGVESGHSCVERVFHSYSDSHGEADLIVLLNSKPEADPSHKTALLIENKINAAFQPDQAARYKLRGERGAQRGDWTHYKTVLVAPAKYVKSTHGFEAVVTFEQLGEWICRHDEPRRKFKLDRLQRAIDKKNATGVQIPDAAMTEFRRSYSEAMEAFNEAHDTGFIVPPPRVAYYDDNWLEWRSKRLPDNCGFRHLSRTGIIELAFKNVPVTDLPWLEPLLADGMALSAVGTHGQHTAIRIRVDPISNFADLGAAHSSVAAALNQAKRMQDLVVAKLADGDIPKLPKA